MQDCVDSRLRDLTRPLAGLPPYPVEPGSDIEVQFLKGSGQVAEGEVVPPTPKYGIKKVYHPFHSQTHVAGADCFPRFILQALAGLAAGFFL